MIESRCGLKCIECEWTAKMNCPGCMQCHGQMWFGKCEVANCCESHNLSHCGKCDKFACEKLLGFAYDKEHGDNGQRIENLKEWLKGNQ